MEKYLIAIAMVLMLGMSAGVEAQKHRHTPRTEQVDSTKNNQDAIEAFSDTTAVADEDSDNIVGYERDMTLTEEEAKRAIKGALSEVFDEVNGGDVAVIIFITFLGLTIIFLPFIILIAVIVYFVNRNRRERIKLAEMAIKNGQPIPEQLLNEKSDEWDKDDYKSGIRQLFLGVGLMIFLGYTAGKIGFAIGALVFFIGLGKVVIAKTTGEKKSSFRGMKDNSDNWNHNNI